MGPEDPALLYETAATASRKPLNVTDEGVALAKNWESYEQVAAHLLGQFAYEFGVDFFQGKQDVAGNRSGTTWQIDAKGVRTADGGFMIVECKRWTKDKQSQETVGGLAYRIIDTGAIGGIVVSPLGLQEGGQKVASAENIFEVHLDENSTRNNFVIHFLNKFMVGSTLNLFISGCAPAEAADSTGQPLKPGDRGA